MTRLVLLLLAPAIVAAAVASVAFGGSPSDVAAVRAATAKFHDVQKAIDAGYTVELPDRFGETCIANLTDPDEGAMGVHLVSLSRVIDPALDPTNPEALVYERRNDGTLKLVAVEYVVFQGAVSEKPELFGVDFDENDGTRYNLDPFYALHAWIWKPNPNEPAGIFSQWNPRVSCET
ncbi:MAG: hypothetical protein ACRDQT_06160 [Gaiellaceae bacterium]